MQCIRQITTATTRATLITVTTRCISTSTPLNMPIKIGDKLPEIDLFEDNPGNKVNTKDLFGSGKSVIFAVPGAFTPTCHNDHVPGFMQNISELKAKGVTTVACIAVNDPFVMGSWAKSLGTDGKIKMLADTNADFTKKIEMDIDLTGPLGGIRSKRYAMVVENGVVTAMAAEPDNTGLSCSKAVEVMKLL